MQSIEPVIDAPKLVIDTVEAPINFVEPMADRVEPLLQTVVCPIHAIHGNAIVDRTMHKNGGCSVNLLVEIRRETQTATADRRRPPPAL